ncbi:hypothetical protein B0T10DRAFT_416042 [Thelonectria olida]|uniref:BZIP domain-containing protein n=1 Tax=Thelonectria olida TaxID=1576542 RepID=A0A9P8VSK2_9HYPO|nr:hypothetical protein B0T10DRAFT_416042 [Thelonectria olida]
MPLGGKRRRGRCPIETQGGTAVDRRRIQNRLAQRAYRQRKEVAIGALKQRVLELEKMNEDIGREYITFTDLVLDQDLGRDCPDVAQRIKETTEKMLRIARNAEANEHDDAPVAEGSFENSPSPAASDSQPLEIPDSYDPGPESVEVHGASENDFTERPNHSALPNSTQDPQVDSHTQGVFENPNLAFSVPGEETGCFFTNCGLPELSYASSLRPPRSYAAQEHTFGRRLHRASQEAGFLLSSMKSPPPFLYSRVFGFCSRFETREEICRRMGDAIRQTREATLNNWRYPFTNLGGAGLFYPQVNNSASHGDPGSGGLPIGNRSLQHEAHKPSELTGFSMGPFSQVVEDVRDLRLDAQLRILDPEFQGDFFDSDEVEISLRYHGVTIPPNKDFVTAHIDLTIFEDDQGVAPLDFHALFGNSSIPQPGSKFVPLHPDAGGFTALGDTECSMGMPSMTPLDAEFCDFTAPPFPEPAGRGDSWKTPRGKRTKVKIDVERLITSLITATVCLGRTPAVRPKDVRESLRESIVEDE